MNKLARSAALARRGLVVAASVAAAGCTDMLTPVETARAPSAPADQKAAADSDWVLTPAGRRPRRCVHQVPNDAHVDPGGKVRRRDGTTFQLPLCQAGGPPERAGQTLAPVISDWVEWASHAPGGNFSRLSANWTVPAKPTGSYSTGQVYYSFPGLQSNSYIIQPVLQYGNNNEYGGQYWTGTSWHCSSGPDCTHSPPISMAAGDAVYGNVTANNCVNGSCSWTISIQNGRTGATSTWTRVDTQNYWYAVGGAVEVYGLSSCSQFPRPGIFYSGIALYNSAGTQVTPSWSHNITPNLNPQCGYSVTSTALAVNLYHNPPPAPAPVVNSVFTTPSPAVQYNPFSITINGSGFDINTVEVKLGGDSVTGCSDSYPCYLTSFTTKTSTQLVISPVTLSIASTYRVYVRNTSTGVWSSGHTITVRSMY